MSEERKQLLDRAQKQNEEFLCIPRRPNWTSETTPEELTKMENENFLVWRRQLAVLQEKENLMLTPFEKNIEFWRQLWRVIERSDVIVQILDARNPLLFLCSDLQKYVNEVSSDKINLILLNKADLLTEKQRRIWANYFVSQNIKAVFFSALQEMQDTEEQDLAEIDNLVIEAKEIFKVLSSTQLLDYFKELFPEITRQITVGLVGYPNVGKSSTINALIKSKKVSVSSTPGKTKHFQTIPLDDEIMLCDCPGLVFPNFVSSKAEMIINGILPIDQMTEHVPPVSLVTSLLPRQVFEEKYGLILPKLDEEDPRRHLTAEELLNAYGYMRGYMTQRGLPDNPRAARYILKDFVSGKLLYCVPPPTYTESDFNEFKEWEESGKSKDIPTQLKRIMKSDKISAQEFDSNFFAKEKSRIHTKGAISVSGCMKNGDDLNEPRLPLSKKHNNRNKREKLRRVYAHLDDK